MVVGVDAECLPNLAMPQGGVGFCVTQVGSEQTMPIAVRGGFLPSLRGCRRRLSRNGCKFEPVGRFGDRFCRS